MSPLISLYRTIYQAIWIIFYSLPKTGRISTEKLSWFNHIYWYLLLTGKHGISSSPSTQVWLFRIITRSGLIARIPYSSNSFIMQITYHDNHIPPFVSADRGIQKSQHAIDRNVYPADISQYVHLPMQSEGVIMRLSFCKLLCLLFLITADFRNWHHD